MVRLIRNDANGKPQAVKYTRETNSFTLSVKHQTGMSPENLLAGAVIQSAMRDILKYGNRRTPFGYLHLDASVAAQFLLKPNPLLAYWCEAAGLNMDFVVRTAKTEVQRFGIDLHPERKKIA